MSPFIYYYALCHYAECRYAECRGAGGKIHRFNDKNSSPSSVGIFHFKTFFSIIIERIFIIQPVPCLSVKKHFAEKCFVGPVNPVMLYSFWSKTTRPTDIWQWSILEGVGAFLSSIRRLYVFWSKIIFSDRHLPDTVPCCWWELTPGMIKHRDSQRIWNEMSPFQYRPVPFLTSW